MSTQQRRPSELRRNSSFLPPLPGNIPVVASMSGTIDPMSVPAAVLGVAESSAVNSMPQPIRKRASFLLHREIPAGAGTIPNMGVSGPSPTLARRKSEFKVVSLPSLTDDLSRSLTARVATISEESERASTAYDSNMSLKKLGEQTHYPSMMSVDFTQRPLVIVATTTARNSTTAGNPNLLEKLMGLFQFHFSKGLKSRLVRRPDLDDIRIDEKEDEDEEDPVLFRPIDYDNTTFNLSPEEAEKVKKLDSWCSLKRGLRKSIRNRQREVLKVLHDSYEADVIRQNNEREFCEEMKRYLEAITLLDLAALTFFNPLERSPKDPDPIPIESGRINENHHSYAQYHNANWADWGSIQSIIFALERICQHYFIQFAAIDTPILTLLAQHPHKSRQLTRPDHLTSCFANKIHIETLLKFPGQRFLNRKPYDSSVKTPFADDATHTAATIIQAKWKAHHLQAIYKQIVPYVRAQKFIAKSWRRKKGRQAMRTAKFEIWRFHESRSVIHKDAWKASWDTIEGSPTVCVWIPSFGTNGEFRPVSSSPADYSLTELMPKFLLLNDPKVSLILVLPRLLEESCWEFVCSQLRISKTVFDERVKILVPENVKYFPIQSSTMSILQASPILMKRLKLLLKDKNAYLLSEKVGPMDFIVSSQLQRPLLGPTGEQTRKLYDPINWREIVQNVGFDVLPGQYLIDREHFFRDFAKTVIKNYPRYSRWVGCYQAPTWHYIMILDVHAFRWKALEEHESIVDNIEISDETVKEFQELVEKHAKVLASAPHDTWEAFHTLGRRFPMWLQALPAETIDTKGVNMKPEYLAATRLIGFHFFCDLPGRNCTFLGTSETLASRYMEPFYTVAPQQSLDHKEYCPKFKKLAEKWMADGYSGHISFTATLVDPPASSADNLDQATKNPSPKEVKIMFVQMYYAKESGIAQWLPLISQSEWNEESGHSLIDISKATEPTVKYMNFIRFMNMDLVKREVKKEERIILWSDCLHHSHASIHTPLTFQTLAHSTGIRLDKRLSTGSCVLPRAPGSNKIPLVCVSSTYRGVLEEWISCIPRMSSFLTMKKVAVTNFTSICQWALFAQKMHPLSRRNIQECRNLVDLCLLFVQSPYLRKLLESIEFTQSLNNSQELYRASSDHLWRNPHTGIADPVKRKLYFVAEFICADIVRDCIDMALQKFPDQIPPQPESIVDQIAKRHGGKSRLGPDGITIIDHEDSDDEIDDEINSILENRANDKLENKMKTAANRFLHANSAVKTLRKLFQTTHDFVTNSQTLVGSDQNINKDAKDVKDKKKQVPSREAKSRGRGVGGDHSGSTNLESAKALSSRSNSTSLANEEGGDARISRERKSPSRIGSGRGQPARLASHAKTDNDSDSAGNEDA